MQGRVVGQFMTECDAPTKTLNVPLCSFGITKPDQKVPELISERTVRRHWAAQGRTLSEHFYLGAMRHVRDAVGRNDQKVADC
jgi:hypothetical protein